MEKLYIICVDDQREVLSALTEDLEPFENYTSIEECESVGEALSVIEEIDAAGDHVALVISDQVMPKNTGVDLLRQITEDSRFQSTRKILLTGLATHQDTIEAINQGSLDQYIEKPWKKTELHLIIKTMLTRFVLEKGLNYQELMPIMDQETLYAELRKTT